MYIYKYISTYICVCMLVWCKCATLCMYIYIYMYTCIYLYIYMHTYVNINIHVYACGRNVDMQNCGLSLYVRKVCVHVQGRGKRISHFFLSELAFVRVQGRNGRRTRLWKRCIKLQHIEIQWNNKIETFISIYIHILFEWPSALLTPCNTATHCDTLRGERTRLW